MKHQILKPLQTQLVTVHVIGCGGNGAQFVNGLARLSMSLKALGHPGIQAYVWDPDRVTPANVGRQLFSPADVGQYKAAVMIHRLNAFWGTDWQAVTQNFGDRYPGSCHIMVGCVDTRKARRIIHGMFQQKLAQYWLDLGNNAKTGQFILGEIYQNDRTAFRLPTVVDLYPEIIAKGEEDDTPSCSLAAALGRQDLFINQAVATGALNLLWSLFRQGGLDYHGGFVNLETGRTNPLEISPEVWARMGYHFLGKPPLRKIVRRLKPKKYMQLARVKLECGHIVYSNGEKKAHCLICQREGRK